MQDDTRIVHAGREPIKQQGAVNPPLVRASTILYPTLDAYNRAGEGEPYYDYGMAAEKCDLSYGITGTSTTFATAAALAEAEGGKHCLLFPSGLSAITLTLLAYLQAGDHMLVTDAVYGPTRRFCKQTLKRYAIETSYYDPCIGADIESLIRPNTRLLFLESPGSLTFEVQDIPAIVAIARKHGITTVIDNSWASPLYFKPFAHGVDISIQALTKYVGGHSDIMAGSVTTASDEHFQTLYKTYRSMGMTISPADCYLIQRGLRTLSARLSRHFQSALEIASWLETHPTVDKILYPPLSSHPQHLLWKRDFLGGCGLFSFILKQHYSKEAVASMLDGMRYFGIGASWGGYESLILDIDIDSARSVTSWKGKGTCIRVHIGLEAPQDLKDDLADGLNRLNLSKVDK